MSLNKNCHAEGPVVTSVEFHPKYALALIAGTSGIFSVYQVYRLYQFISHDLREKIRIIYSLSFIHP